MAQLNQQKIILKIIKEVNNKGASVLDEVNLNDKYYNQSKTNICITAREGGYYVLADETLRFIGKDKGVQGAFKFRKTGGWRQLGIPVSYDLGKILEYTEQVLGLNGQEPFISWAEEKTQESNNASAKTLILDDRENIENQKKSKTKMRFGEDLVLAAEEGKIEEPIGRDKEMQSIIQVISKYKKNACILLGEPGVGKTAIVEGLALKIHKGNVPESIKNKRIYSLNMGFLAAEAPYYNELLAIVKGIISEAKKDDRIILFIDEAHMLIDPRHDVSQILKADLGRNLSVIAATTNKEYHRFIAPDEAFARRFQRIPINEISPAECLEVIKGIRGRYEAQHGVKIPDELIPYIIKVSIRYVKDRVLPDKAIDLLDEACSRLRIINMSENEKELIINPK